MTQIKNTGLYIHSKTVIRFLGTFMMLSLLTFQAQAQTDNSIVAISANDTHSGATVIKVELAHPITQLPAGFTVSTPPRIALDFANTSNALKASAQDFSLGSLRSANIVQAGTRTRLVINLNQMLPYDTRLDGNSVLITLHEKVADTATRMTTSRFADADKSAQSHALTELGFRRGKNGEGRIQVDLSDSGVGIDIHRQGTKLLVDFINASVPQKLQRKLDVVDFATPIQSVDTFKQGRNVRMVIEPQGIWEHAAYQTDNKFFIEVKPVAEDKDKLIQGGHSGYAGDKLTLNFQDISVREALNVIADFTGLNMVISDSVSGNLTLRLTDVPWDQALDIILQSRGLDKRQTDNVIQVAPREELAKFEKDDLTSRLEISELEELRTESFRLGYQTASDVKILLEGPPTVYNANNATPPPSQRILSKRGSATVDARTNTLFIKDTSFALEEARKLIKQIDVPVRQVMIEARFVSAGDSFNRTLGGKLGYTGPTNGVPAPGAGDAIGNNLRALVQPNVNLPGAANVVNGGGLILSLFNPAATKILTLELSASEIDNVTKNIASPRVVTADKTKATIKSGVEIPYTIAGTNGGPPTTSFKQAVLSLEVTPQITPDDHINMKLIANQDTVGALYGGIPSLNKKEVATEVLVENGGTVVVGGVFTQDHVIGTNKVPLLGDVPVLGWLFKNENKRDDKSELLIFITPKIMQDAMNLR